MGKHVDFTKEQLNEIAEKYKSGMPATAIAKEYNVSSQTIRRRLDSMNIESRKTRKYFINEHVFDKIDSSEKAYWLGFILSDGYLNEARGFMRLKLGELDKDHVEKFAKFMGYKDEDNAVKFEYHNITGKKIYYTTINSKYFTKRLVELGVRQAKSANEQWCNEIPKEYIKDYIRGIIDADGYISYKKFDICGSEDVLSHIKVFFKNKYSLTSHDIQDHCNTKRLYMHKLNRESALNDIYYDNAVSLDRKYKIVKENYSN